jgi:hypothetical protein
MYEEEKYIFINFLPLAIIIIKEGQNAGYCENLRILRGEFSSRNLRILRRGGGQVYSVL